MNDSVFFNESSGFNVTELPNTTINVDLPLASGGFQDIQDAFYIVGYIISPTFLLIGLFGNAITIVTMMSKEFSDLTSRYILIALAISDTTLLLTQPFNKLFVRKLIGYDVRALSDLSCKIFFHIFKTGKMTSSWLIVILCFERFIAVVFPFKTKQIITKKSVLGMIFLDYLFIGTYNGIWTFSSIVVNGVCKPDVTYPHTKEKYRQYLLAGSSFYSLIPMVVMAILTPVIVAKLWKQRSKRKAMTGSSSASSEKANTEAIRISAMLIGVVVAYITFILPITVVHNLAFWRNVSAFDTNTKGFFILREVAQNLEQMNYSTNFILYVLCSAKFRKKATHLLKLHKIRSMIQSRKSTKSKSATDFTIQKSKMTSGSNENKEAGLDNVLFHGNEKAVDAEANAI